MPKRHKNLFHTISREQFEEAVQNLHQRIPRLARHEIILEMARIVAMVGDGHTNIYPTRDPKIGFHTLPIKLYLFKDGFFIRAAEKEDAGLVGARVIRIGKLSTQQAVARVREIIGHDNEMGVKFFAPQLLVMPEVLHGLEITDDLEAAAVVIEKNGQEQTVLLHPSGLAEIMPSDVDLSWMSKEGWVDMRDGAKTQPPLWLQDPQNKFWFEYLPESRAVYVQINQVGDKETETLAAFSKRLFAFVDSSKAEKLVLDLRLNRGGNGTLLPPLVAEIIRSPLNRPGRLFTIIGRSTFSAAQFLVNDLERYSNTLFVGEPSGSKGNSYGDSRKIMLPNSGLTVRVSIYYWQDWYPWDTRPWTAPHLTAELTSEQYRTNSDPAMKLILNYVLQKPLGELLEEAFAKKDVELAKRRFRMFRNDPVNLYYNVQEEMFGLGQRLLRKEKLDYAIEVLNLNAEADPQSWITYEALSDLYAARKDKELAIKSLETALKLNPKNSELKEKLNQLKQR
ncbi:MAG: S41 family peptidase [candidate division Zixibacteria bacterium]|nr:S41 family peptidase [candidate division Zixibacteria bacterium]